MACSSEKEEQSRPPHSQSTEETFHLLAMGDSLTEGLGLKDESKSYPAQLEQRLRAEGLPVRLTNAGVSGETSAGGLRRVEWIASQEPDLILLFLGSNDALRGIPPEETRVNLTGIVDGFLAEQIPVVLIETRAPQSMGEAYVQQTAEIYQELAQREEFLVLSFPLEEVLFQPEFVQEDGIHPNAEGYAIMVEQIFSELQSYVEQQMEQGEFYEQQ